MCGANPAPVAGPRCEDGAARWPASSVSWPDPQSLLARSGERGRRPSNGFAPHMRQHNRGGPAESGPTSSGKRARRETAGNVRFKRPCERRDCERQTGNRERRACACCTHSPGSRNRTFPAVSASCLSEPSRISTGPANSASDRGMCAAQGSAIHRLPPRRRFPGVGSLPV
jgi:hypothetical protein